MEIPGRIRRSREGIATGRRAPPSRNPRPDISSRPLIIGGMHRSGTSLTASLFATAGLDLGNALLGGNESNALGHFEDLGFFHFHRRVLLAQGLGSDGYTTSERGVVPANLESEAHGLLAARVRPGVAWGWKEPRTTLFLDFWQERLPDARHLFVFRRPWEVADSLFRRGDETFVLNPMLALAIWTHYNRLILDFVRRHPANCLVFEISQVIADPEQVFSAVRSRLEIPLGSPAPRYREDLFTVDHGYTHAAIVRGAAPAAWRTYLELRDLAGEAKPLAAARQHSPPGEITVLEWARAVRAGVQARQNLARAEHEARVRAELEAQLQAEREARLHFEHRASRRLPAVLKRALRRAADAMSRPVKAVRMRLRFRPRPERSAPAAVLRPLPRSDHAPVEARAA